VTTPVRRSQALPRGVTASAVIGMAAGGVAWLPSNVWSSFTASYVRLDQWTALGLGAVVGAAVLAAREFRQRRRFGVALAAGALLGGAGALAGTSALALAYAATTPGSFLLQRIAAWGLAGLLTVAALSLAISPRRTRMMVESTGIAVSGGAIGGVIYTLPGATDLWQALAFLWFGAVVGIAACGPELWSAVAVVETLPPRGTQLELLSLHEALLYDDTIAVGEARLASVAGGVALYPPAGGVIADGHHVRQPRFLRSNTELLVGRMRYRVRVFQ
jgi:hypothetical protein